MVDLLIPVAHRNPIGYGYSPLLDANQMERVVAITAPRRELADLAQIFGGRAVKPRQELVITGPDGHTPILVCGLGEAEVAELEDTAHAALEAAESEMKRTGRAFPFEEMRERRGYPRAERFGELLHDACEQYVQKIRRNSRTMKPKEIFKTKGQSMVSMPDQPWKHRKEGAP